MEGKSTSLFLLAASSRAMIWSTEAACATLLAQTLPVHRPPIDCSWPPPPPAPRLRPLSMMMLDWCLASGSRLPPLGKVQAVSEPVGYQVAGTVPDDENNSSRRFLSPAWPQASSEGMSGAAAAPTPRALSSWRRLRPLPSGSVLRSFMDSPSGDGKNPTVR